jgi:hypothetical protein
MKTPSFIAAILLALVAIVASWFLGLSILSFGLTSLILVLMLILLIRILFKSSRNLASWFKFRHLDDGSGYGSLANAASTVKWAAGGSYHGRIEIADVLRNALISRFGGQPAAAHWRLASRESVREELATLVGMNPKLLEILDPKEDERRRHRFRTRPSREEEYLSGLEEAIRIVSESET